MDFENVEKLIQLVKTHGINSLEVKNDDFQVKIKLHADGPAAGAGANAMASFSQYPTQAFLPPQPPTVQAHPQSAPPTEAAPKPAANAKHKEVRSPFVGTYYEAPSPGAEPFVQVGQQVTEGMTLCIVEAMKLLNEIEAEVSGKIVEIMVKNGDPVEFDQVLFIVE